MAHPACSAALTGTILAVMLLHGCDSGSASGQVATNEASGATVAATATATATATAISLPAPHLLQGRAIIQDALQAEMTVNGRSAIAQRNGDSWSASFNVLPGENLMFSLVWYQVYIGNVGLALATLDETYPSISQGSSIQIDDSRYVTSGAGLDLDNDGISNLAELDGDSNPFDAASPGQGDTVNGRSATVTAGHAEAGLSAWNGAELALPVEIPRIAATRAPVIDGLYDAVWDDAGYVDTSGALLSIDNLVSGGVADHRRSDQDTEFRWGAMHDGSNLYLFVLGEATLAATPTNDSQVPPGTLQDDDSLELFFAGDDSRVAGHDSIGATHVVIALLDQEGNTIGRVQNGDNASVGLPAGLSFFNCLCAPQHTWEVSIPLASLGIQPGKVFGLELQINDDIDGGDRDAKWAWFSPAGQDVTAIDPSVMGRARLAE